MITTAPPTLLAAEARPSRHTVVLRRQAPLTSFKYGSIDRDAVGVVIRTLCRALVDAAAHAVHSSGSACLGLNWTSY